MLKLSGPGSLLCTCGTPLTDFKSQPQRFRHCRVGDLSVDHIDAFGQARVGFGGRLVAFVRRSSAHTAAWRCTARSVLVRPTAPGMFVTQ